MMLKKIEKLAILPVRFTSAASFYEALYRLGWFYSFNVMQPPAVQFIITIVSIHVYSLLIK